MSESEENENVVQFVQASAEDAPLNDPSAEQLEPVPVKVSLFDEPIEADRKALDDIVAANPALPDEPSSSFVPKILEVLEERPEVLERDDAFAFSKESRPEVLMRYGQQLLFEGQYDRLDQVIERSKVIIGEEGIADYMTARKVDEVERFLKEGKNRPLARINESSDDQIKAYVQERAMEEAVKLFDPKALLEGKKAVEQLLKANEHADSIGLFPLVDLSLDDDSDIQNFSNPSQREYMRHMMEYARGVMSTVITDLARNDDSMFNLFAALDNNYSLLVDTLRIVEAVQDFYILADPTPQVEETEEATGPDEEEAEEEPKEELDSIPLQTLELVDLVRGMAFRRAATAKDRLADFNKELSAYNPDDTSNQEGVTRLLSKIETQEQTIADASGMLLRSDALYVKFYAGEPSRQTVSVMLNELGYMEEAASIAGQLEQDQVLAQRLLKEAYTNYLGLKGAKEEMSETQFGKVLKKLVGSKRDTSDGEPRMMEVFRKLKANDVYGAAKQSTDTSGLQQNVWTITVAKYESGQINEDALRNAASVFDPEMQREGLMAEEMVFEKAIGNRTDAEQFYAAVNPVIRSGSKELADQFWRWAEEAYTSQEELLDENDVLTFGAELKSVDPAKETDAERIVSEGLLKAGSVTSAVSHIVKCSPKDKERLEELAWKYIEAQESEMGDTDSLMAAGTLGSIMRGKRAVTARNIADYQKEILRLSGIITDQEAEYNPQFKDVESAAGIAAECGDAELMENLLEVMVEASFYDQRIESDTVVTAGDKMNLKRKANLGVGILLLNSREYDKAAKHLLEAGQEGQPYVERMWEEWNGLPVAGIDAEAAQEYVLDETVIRKTTRLLEDARPGSGNRLNRLLVEKAMTKIRTKGLQKNGKYLQKIADLAINTGDPRTPNRVLDVMLDSYKRGKIHEEHLLTFADQFDLKNHTELSIAQINYYDQGDAISAVKHAKEAGERGAIIVEDIWRLESEKYTGTDDNFEDAWLTLADLTDRKDSAYDSAIETRLANGRDESFETEARNHQYARAVRLAKESEQEHQISRVKQAVEAAGHAGHINYVQVSEHLAGLGYEKEAQDARGLYSLITGESIEEAILAQVEQTAEPVQPPAVPSEPSEPLMYHQIDATGKEVLVGGDQTGGIEYQPRPAPQVPEEPTVSVNFDLEDSQD